MLKRLMRFVPTVLLIMVLLTVLMNLVMLMIGWMGYWTNITDSMPVGVYKETEEKITKNSYVLLCKEDSFLQRAKSEGECDDGHKPLLKSVVAVGGDVVTVSDGGVFVNYRKLKNSERLKNIRVQAKNIVDYTLQNDEFLVMGRSPFSWDSRYFGIVRGNEFISQVVPVFLFYSKYEDFQFDD